MRAPSVPGTTGDPVRGSECGIRLPGVHEDHLRASVLRFHEPVRDPHRAVDRAADEHDHGRVIVIRVDLILSLILLSERENPAGVPRCVAGCLVPDLIDRPKRKGRPLLNAGERVARVDDGGFAILLDDRLQLLRDPVERLVPRDFLKLSFAPGADPLQRLLQPVGACPEHRGLRRAPAHAALRMRRIREHAHRRETRLHARLLHDDETASAAANLAGDGVCFPPFFLQGFNLLRDHFP